jgi:hypothetical protein
LGPAVLLASLTFDLLRREIARTNERYVDIKLETAFGTVILSKGERDKIVVAEYWRSEKMKQKLSMDYETRGDRGRLDIEIKESSWRDDAHEVGSWQETKSERGSHEENEWYLKFSDAIPMSYDIELGAGRGKFDFTGLKVRDLKISAGASSVQMRVGEPNAEQCERVEIESGVSKFVGTDLCNLNFKRLRFSGGVGAYKLDFGGTLQESATVDIEVGLGAVTVIVPRETATRVISDDSWFSTLDVDEAFEQTRRKGVYETASFSTSDRTLTIKVESGLGSVKVRTR